MEYIGRPAYVIFADPRDTNKTRMVIIVAKMGGMYLVKYVESVQVEQIEVGQLFGQPVYQDAIRYITQKEWHWITDSTVCRMEVGQVKPQ